MWCTYKMNKDSIDNIKTTCVNHGYISKTSKNWSIIS